MMQTKYLQWINENYHTVDLCKNKCNEAVRAMIAKFPELRVQVGLANGVLHCWTIDEDHRIVDPTAKQFECFVGKRYARNSTIKYTFIADRFLQKHEYEPATGAIFLDA
jgi:hypothetical protein